MKPQFLRVLIFGVIFFVGQWAFGYFKSEERNFGSIAIATSIASLSYFLIMGIFDKLGGNKK